MVSPENQSIDPERSHTSASESTDAGLSSNGNAPRTEPCELDSSEIKAEVESGNSDSAGDWEANHAELSEVEQAEEVDHGWWKRPCGGKEVVTLALPLVISTVSYTLMHFCDRLFLTWYSQDAMAAVMPAGVLQWTMFSLPMGIAGYATTFVAQYVGANQPSKVGQVVWQAIWLSVFSLPFFGLVALICPWIFEVSGHSSSLTALEVTYFRILSIGAGAAVLSSAMDSFFIGRGKTSIVMWITLASTGLNIVLDWLFIFGWAFIPEMGIAGAAIATIIAMWFRVFFYIFAMSTNRKNIREFGLGKLAFNRQLFGRLIRFGGPSGLQYMVEGGAISVFTLLVARIGKLEAAATTLAFSINMLVFVPVIGVGMAVGTLVGQQIGKGTPGLAARATWTALQISLGMTIIFAVFFIFTPQVFLAGHAAGSENFGELQELSCYLLRFVAAYCIFDSIQVIFSSAIKGAGDTFFVLFATIISCSLFVIVGLAGTYLLPIEHQLNWWWFLVTGWIWLLAIMYTIRFLKGKWKSMTVIEKQVVDIESNEVGSNEVGSNEVGSVAIGSVEQ